MAHFSLRTAFSALTIGAVVLGTSSSAFALSPYAPGGYKPGNIQPTNPGALKPGAVNAGKLGLGGGGVKIPSGPMQVGGPAKIPPGFGKGHGHGKGWGHGHGYGYGGAIAAGVIGGMALGAIAASQPVYAEEECYAVRKRFVDEDGFVRTGLVTVCE